MKGRPPGSGRGPGKPSGPPRGKAPAKGAGPSRGRSKPSDKKPSDKKPWDRAASAKSPFAKKPANSAGRARGPVKAAQARRSEGAPSAAPAARAAPAAPAKAAPRKGVTLDVRTFKVGVDDDGIRLDRWFQRHLPDIGFNTVSRWARTGQLRVEGARADPSDRIAAGQSIRVPPAEPKPEREAKPRRVRPELSEEQTQLALGMVIHRDAQAIVLNKPPGLATQGGTRTDEHVDGLLDALEFDLDQRPKLVHRLDKDTSGALLIARTARSAASFAKAFSSRTARKVYWALVIGVPSIADGMIELPIAKQPGTGGEKMHVDEAEGLPARTRYRVIERAGNRAAWVELQPYTGRTHQLRVHLAAIGHPIVGDGKYGGKEAFLSGTISRKMHLHARRIRVDHPDGGRVDVKADPPEHFVNSLTILGFDQARGDIPLDEEVARAPTREDEKKFARAHAKQFRKERRGERRSRGEK